MAGEDGSSVSVVVVVGEAGVSSPLVVTLAKSDLAIDDLLR
jgi:hypothetical protein